MANLRAGENSESKRLRFLNRSAKRFTAADTLALFAISTFGLHIISFLVLLLLYGSYSQLSKKAPPSLVQLETGKSITVAPIGSKERTPQVITRFVSDTMTLMMNWSGTLPPTTVEEAAKPKRDPGVSISERGAKTNKVASGAWQASYALSEDFRREFLGMLASITPPGVFKGRTQVVLVPTNIQSPVSIADGKWKVKMIANLTVLDQGNNLGEVIPFNKEIFVQAVEAPKSPSTASGLAAIVYQVRLSGLEIYAIRDLPQENL
jgi:hypothetical protein